MKYFLSPLFFYFIFNIFFGVSIITDYVLLGLVSTNIILLIFTTFFMKDINPTKRMLIKGIKAFTLIMTTVVNILRIPNLYISITIFTILFLAFFIVIYRRIFILKDIY